MSDLITTERMIEWAESKARNADRMSEMVAEHMRNGHDVEAHRLTKADWDEDGDIARATARRLRLIQQMTEVLQSHASGRQGS